MGLLSDPPGHDADGVRAFRFLPKAGRDAAPLRVALSEVDGNAVHGRMLPCSIAGVKG
jgi:hypothetical protein